MSFLERCECSKFGTAQYPGSRWRYCPGRVCQCKLGFGGERCEKGKIFFQN